jgi:hypothetical protein
MAKIACPLCIHNHFDGTCTAFPIEIPLVFASGEKAHTEPMFDQDNPEIVFQRGTLGRAGGEELGDAAIDDLRFGLPLGFGWYCPFAYFSQIKIFSQRQNAAFRLCKFLKT